MGNTTMFVIYSIILLVISIFTVTTLPETKGKDLSAHADLDDAIV
jgi:hypothetical protein